MLRQICSEQMDALSRKVLQEYEQDAGGVADALNGDSASGTTMFSDWRHQAADAVRTEELRCWQAFRRWLDRKPQC